MALIGLIFSSCLKKRSYYFDGFSRNEKGLYYKIVFIGDDQKKIQVWQEINYSYRLKKLNDSLVFSSENETRFISALDTLDKNRFEYHLVNLAVGDSVFYLIKPRAFFEHYFRMGVPLYIKNDSLVKLELVINNTNYSVDSFQMRLKEEMKDINTFLVNKSTVSVNKVYHNDLIDLSVPQKNQNPEKVTFGKSITVDYKGFFLNDSLIDKPLYPMQFTYGTPDQMIEGLNFVINGMSKGETKKIILPSHLAYGKAGSSNGIIPPFTPLLYEIKIIDVK